MELKTAATIYREGQQELSEKTRHRLELLKQKQETIRSKRNLILNERQATVDRLSIPPIDTHKLSTMSDRDFKTHIKQAHLKMRQTAAAIRI